MHNTGLHHFRRNRLTHWPNRRGQSEKTLSTLRDPGTEPWTFNWSCLWIMVTFWPAGYATAFGRCGNHDISEYHPDSLYCLDAVFKDSSFEGNWDEALWAMVLLKVKLNRFVSWMFVCMFFFFFFHYLCLGGLCHVDLYKVRNVCRERLCKCFQQKLLNVIWRKQRYVLQLPFKIIFNLFSTKKSSFLFCW